MLHHPEVFFRKVRHFFSRSRWLIRLLKLPPVSEKPDRPGVILVQIDALSRRQLEAALRTGRMPFLKKLLDRQRYTLRTHYSGLVCATPVVQGELFYGIPSCIPAFSYYDKQAGRVFTLFNPDDANTVQERLAARGTGLFEHGSCYSNIYTGGAAEPHFCIADLQVRRMFRQWRTFSFLIAVGLHVFSLLRAGALLALEFVIAVVDFFRGLIAGRNLWKELKFIPSRVAVCILLREIIVIGAKLDIARGLPIIQMNFMGYHEQSHRRGATSRFAHWTLKGIDDAIKRIWQTAHRGQKTYEFWVYSDHGQVDTTPYTTHYEQTIREVVEAVLHMEKPAAGGGRYPNRPGFLNRLGWRRPSVDAGPTAAADEPPVTVTTLGPMAHVYLHGMPRDRVRGLAEELLQTGKMPTLLIPEAGRVVRVITHNTTYELPRQADAFFFENHFVTPEIVEDFIQACHHPDAGDLIISGYQGPHAPYLSFVKENGSHGGVKQQEYTGFFLGPENAPVDDEKGYVRPTNIRHGAFRVLGRPVAQVQDRAPYAAEPSYETFRILTYNVHSCVGMDGRHSPLRIARVIEQFNPDIVALQELDVGRQRSGHTDQARVIADILQMDHFFHPAIALEEEQYGDAILSRFPVRLVKTDILPGYDNVPGREPRGALWVQVEIGPHRVQVVNTHLGLTFQERRKQVDALLGDEWLGHADFAPPAVLCGDYNFTPRSKLYQRCRQALKAAEPTAGLQGTYCGRYPLIRLDHLFFTEGLVLQECITGDTDLARMASDHRPLIGTFAFASSASTGT